jgi:hypothetical protein
VVVATYTYIEIPQVSSCDTLIAVGVITDWTADVGTIPRIDGTAVYVYYLFIYF